MSQLTTGPALNPNLSQSLAGIPAAIYLTQKAKKGGKIVDDRRRPNVELYMRRYR